MCVCAQARVKKHWPWPKLRCIKTNMLGKNKQTGNNINLLRQLGETMMDITHNIRAHAHITQRNSSSHDKWQLDCIIQFMLNMIQKLFRNIPAQYEFHDMQFIDSKKVHGRERMKMWMKTSYIWGGKSCLIFLLSSRSLSLFFFFEVSAASFLQQKQTIFGLI